MMIVTIGKEALTRRPSSMQPTVVVITDSDNKFVSAAILVAGTDHSIPVNVDGLILLRSEIDDIIQTWNLSHSADVEVPE